MIALMTQTTSTPAPSSDFRPIVCHSLDGKEATGHVTLKHLTSSERMKMALKRLGIFWLVALLFIPVPILHFIFVPLFLVVGLVAFYLGVTSSRERIAGGKAVCPLCQSPIEIPSRAFARTFKAVCPSCRHEVRISLLS
jgi:hypothetical protein